MGGIQVPPASSRGPHLHDRSVQRQGPRLAPRRVRRGHGRHGRHGRRLGAHGGHSSGVSRRISKRRPLVQSTKRLNESTVASQKQVGHAVQRGHKGLVAAITLRWRRLPCACRQRAAGPGASRAGGGGRSCLTCMHASMRVCVCVCVCVRVRVRVRARARGCCRLLHERERTSTPSWCGAPPAAQLSQNYWLAAVRFWPWSGSWTA
jgi:hypothetical protein